MSIASSLDLVSTSLGEGDAEKPQCVVVCGFDIDMRLDQSLPLLNQGPELVGCEVHTLEMKKRESKNSGVRHKKNMRQCSKSNVLNHVCLPRTGSTHSCPGHLQL